MQFQRTASLSSGLWLVTSRMLILLWMLLVVAWRECACTEGGRGGSSMWGGFMGGRCPDVRLLRSAQRDTKGSGVSITRNLREKEKRVFPPRNNVPRRRIPSAAKGRRPVASRKERLAQ